MWIYMEWSRPKEKNQSKLWYSNKKKKKNDFYSKKMAVQRIFRRWIIEWWKWVLQNPCLHVNHCSNVIELQTFFFCSSKNYLRRTLLKMTTYFPHSYIKQSFCKNFVFDSVLFTVSILCMCVQEFWINGLLHCLNSLYREFSNGTIRSTLNVYKIQVLKRFHVFISLFENEITPI